MDIEILMIYGNRHTQEDGSVIWNNAQYNGWVVTGTTDDTEALKKEALSVTNLLLEELTK